MKNNQLLIIVVLVLLVVGGFFFFTQSGKMPGYQAPATTTTTTEDAMVGAPTSASQVILTAQNASGQNGTATLKEVNGKTVVSITVVAADATTAQPAHIHIGSCPNPGDVKYPLTSIVNGKSETTLNVPLATLLGELPLAINIHKSAAEAKVYTSCGNLSSY